MSTLGDPAQARMTGLVWWALRYASRRSGLLASVGALQWMQVFLDLLKPWPMVILIDYVLLSKPVSSQWIRWLEWLPGDPTPVILAGWCVAATVALFLAGWALGLGQTYASITLGQRLAFDLAIDLLARLQSLSLRFHAGSRVGDQVRRVTADSHCVATLVRDALLPVTAAAVSLASMFLILWRIHPGLAWLALAVVPVMTVGFWRHARPMLDKGYEQQEAEARTYEVMEQTFSAIPMLQAFGREPDQDARLRSANVTVMSALKAVTREQLGFKLWIGLGTALGTALVLWVGAQQVLASGLTVGAILLFLSYLASLYTPLETILYTSSTVQSASASGRRVLEIFEARTEVADLPGAREMGRVQGHLKLDEVTVGYESGRPVLREISLEIAPGETVALVGATGAGKSTLASLIPRFMDPWSGQVRVDGQDVREVRLKGLRRNVALVLQEPFLFPISIAENIAYGRPGVTKEEIEAAARAAQAHEFIGRLPQGYETVVGERGATLSGGERQRIAIARALLKDAPILILDEPTSAVDIETEVGLMAALEVLMRNRTTLLIAHRLSTVRRASRIAVLEAGRVVEQGTHEQLLAASGIYARWCRLQSSAASAPGSEESHGT